MGRPRFDDVPATSATTALEQFAPASAAALCGVWGFRAAKCAVCIGIHWMELGFSYASWGGTVLHLAMFVVFYVFEYKQWRGGPRYIL